LSGGRAPQVAAEASPAQGGCEHPSERIVMREQGRGTSNAAMGRIAERNVVRDPAGKG
jgi:hypothetical protein